MSTTERTHDITSGVETFGAAVFQTARCSCGWTDMARSKSASTRAINKHLEMSRFDGHELRLSRQQIGMTPIAPSRPVYGTVARCACGWKTRVNESPSKGGNGRATALWKIHAETAVRTPFQRGQDAYRAGVRRIVPVDLFNPYSSTPVGSQDLTDADEWYRGWDTANLAAPVEDESC